MHDEPIWEGDKVVGPVTSGTVGARTGKHFALGLIDIGRAEKLSETAARRFRIQVGCQFHDATALTSTYYDPTGTKMRGRCSKCSGLACYPPPIHMVGGWIALTNFQKGPDGCEVVVFRREDDILVDASIATLQAQGMQS